MLLKDFVRTVLSDLHSLNKKSEQLNRFDLIVQHESQTAFKNLKVLLSHFANSSLIADENTLKPFVDFLRRRCSLIMDSEAIICYNPKTYGNMAAYALAKELSPLVNIPVLKLLFPSLVLGEYDYDIAPDRIIISDDNKTIIDVFACLENARKRPEHTLMHTHPINGQNPILSEQEQARIINYSYQTKRYYEEILAQKSEQILDKTRNDLRKKMGYCSILFSYGAQGQTLLASKVYPQKDQIISILMTLDPQAWGVFLDNFNPDFLSKLFLNNQNVASSVLDKHNYKPDQQYNTVIYAIHMYLYRKELDQEKAISEHTSFIGRISGYGYSKSHKAKIADFAFKLIQQGTELNQLQQKILESVDKDKGLSDYEKIRLKGAVKQGRFKSLMQQTEKLSLPEYFNEEATSSWHLSWRK